MKVTNPNPSLVNVRTKTGAFIRVGPGAEVDIGDANVDRELRAKILVKSGSKDSDREANEAAAAKAPASVRAAGATPAGNWGGAPAAANTAKKAE